MNDTLFDYIENVGDNARKLGSAPLIIMILIVIFVIAAVSQKRYIAVSALLGVIGVSLYKFI